MSTRLHVKALELARTYSSSERALLEVLMEMSERREFISLGYLGIFDYCTKALSLSEAQACYFQRVAVKSKEVPALKKAIVSGEISLSQGRRITSVITQQNSQEWIEKARTLKQRELEAQVAEVNPKAAIKERIRPIASSLREMRVALTPEEEKLIEQVRDLLSQKNKKAVTLQEAIREMSEFFLEKNDPIKKAERASSRTAKRIPAPQPGRHAIPAQVKHQVHLRDGNQCTAMEASGRRCERKRWLHLHHKRLVSQGGLNTPENLQTLCSAHHAHRHDQIALSIN